VISDDRHSAMINAGASSYRGLRLASVATSKVQTANAIQAMAPGRPPTTQAHKPSPWKARPGGAEIFRADQVGGDAHRDGPHHRARRSR
jgi:hypothetical protein